MPNKDLYLQACHPPQLRPKGGQHMVALCGGKGILGFAEGRATERKGPKDKQPVV